MPPPARPRVLVVDDECSVRDLVARALEPAHEVVAASHALAALHALERDAFDAIVCDLGLPGMSGMELHAAVVARSAAQAARMIFLTGGPTSDEARRFLERYRTRALAKPFALAALLAAVQRACGGVSPT
jgi:CheY-like chemotaxis protein